MSVSVTVGRSAARRSRRGGWSSDDSCTEMDDAMAGTWRTFFSVWLPIFPFSVSTSHQQTSRGAEAQQREGSLGQLNGEVHEGTAMVRVAKSWRLIRHPPSSSARFLSVPLELLPAVLQEQQRRLTAAARHRGQRSLGPASSPASPQGGLGPKADDPRKSLLPPSCFVTRLLLWHWPSGTSDRLRVCRAREQHESNTCPTCTASTSHVWRPGFPSLTNRCVSVKTQAAAQQRSARLRPATDGPSHSSFPWTS